jgi:hypothetical protein
MRNNVLRVVAAAVFVCFFLPATSHAYIFVDHDIFYNTCGSGRVIVGEWQQTCDGTITSWGVAYSDFVEEIETTCRTGHQDTYYMECGNPVSSLDVCIC